jgi:hypothetical protein
MPKYTVKVQPLGLLNGNPWPEVGETIELPDAVAKGMVAAGHLEDVKPAKKAAAKSEDRVEKRPASKANVETRKS